MSIDFSTGQPSANRVTEPLDKMVDMIFNELDLLNTELKNLVTPGGTADSPGRTCRDIHYEYPLLEDGK